MRPLGEIVSYPQMDLLGDPQIQIRGLAYHSKQVQEGFLFACLPGSRTDGHLFIQEALGRGAVALLVERSRLALAPSPPIAPLVVADETRPALALISSAFYGWPSQRLSLIGITGTNGKTTTSHLVTAILSKAGRRTGLIGTLAYRTGDETFPAPYTTPEAPDLQALLFQMAEAGLSHVAMEVSSHALALHRVLGCRFRHAVFTNLTRDHLDFHPSMEQYRLAKALLFQGPDLLPLEGERLNVINLDDESGPFFLSRARGRSITYAIQAKADITATRLRLSTSGTRFLAHTPHGTIPVHLRLVGRFNVCNALAALGVAMGEGLEMGLAVGAMEEVAPVQGRFEMVGDGRPKVVVDYAHTPDGLENALASARELSKGRVILVFGCGGDRDPGKRPVMGEIAARLADLCVVTSDNPRREEPQAIIAQILAGMPQPSKHLLVEPDRRKAIAMAVQEARPKDLVLIAGKGHETYQIMGEKRIPFDDREVAREALRCLSP